MERQTRKKILVWIAVSLGAVLVGASLAYLAYIGQFSRYLDRSYGFFIKYPRLWERIEHPQPGGAVIFVSPKETPVDSFRESVNISVTDVPPDLTGLKEFSDKAILQMTKSFSNIKMIESKEVMFGDRKGYKVLFSAEKPDPINVLTVWTIRRGEKAYILTYMAASRHYKTYLNLVEFMIKSFRMR
jgi:eukaryotic-like serine/threonine-protein kinase